MIFQFERQLQRKLTGNRIHRATAICTKSTRRNHNYPIHNLTNYQK